MFGGGMIRTSTVLALLATPFSRAGYVQERATPAAWSNYNDNGVFYPSQDATSWRTLYARTLQLPDLSLLLSWEDYDPTVSMAYWPVYRSTDGGASFSPLSRVQDQVNGWGNWYQPFLYTLPQAMGGYPAGTILITGVSTPRNLSAAYIDLYASEDQGKTWTFVSHIVHGAGPETVDNGNKAVWEPFFIMYQNQLVCYFSDQRDPAHAQKLSHTTTTDLKSWTSPVDDVIGTTYNQRPGMATVAYSTHSKIYVMTFEYCGGPLTNGCPVYYKVASSPLAFGSAQPAPLINDTNADPQGSPYVIWTPNPGTTDGTGVFIASGGSKEQLFINDDYAGPNGWKSVDVGQWSAYSRSLRVIDTPANSAAKGKKKLLIANGGNIGCSGSCYNYVADGLIDIPYYPA